MTQMRVKLSVAGIVLAAAVGYLVYAAVGAAEPSYMSIDAFFADAAKHGAGRVRLRGTVAQENLVINPNELTASFYLVGQKRSLPVRYSGVLPNMFAAGREVIVRGKMGEDGVFKVDELLAKCPSKYAEMPKESEKPQ